MQISMHKCAKHMYTAHFQHSIHNLEVKLQLVPKNFCPVAKNRSAFTHAARLRM